MPFALMLLLAPWLARSSAVETPGVGLDRMAMAAAGPRPIACSVARPSRWDRASDPRVERTCGLLAQGHALLRRSPEVALERATAAEALGVERDVALLLGARALSRLGRHDAAWVKFQAMSPRAPVEGLGALHDLAITAGALGEQTAAIWAYRALVPRLGLALDPAWRERVLLEAAVCAMASGPPGLTEALGYVTEAQRAGFASGQRTISLAVLALVLDRSGRRPEAASVIERAGGPWALEASGASAAEPKLPPGERDAVVAVLASGYDAELAREAWDRFLEQASASPWRDHAIERRGR